LFDATSQFLNELDKSKLQRWWLTHAGAANVPNWDLIVMATLDGAPALVLVEAKAHSSEFDCKPKSRERRDSPEAQKRTDENHDRIGQAIDQASVALSQVAPGVSISRDHCYQLSNRIAIAWKLASIGIPNTLVFLGFTGDSEIAKAGVYFADENHWRLAFASYASSSIPMEYLDLDLSGGAANFRVIARSLPALRLSRPLSERKTRKLLPAAKTDDNQRQGPLRSLIAQGKSQGYLIRAEAIAMLPAELFAADMRNSVLQMISEMGIPVVSERPTAAERVAMQTASVSAALNSVVSPRIVSEPIGPPVIALSVGAEGGAIKLIAQELVSGWRYRYTLLDQTELWLDEGASEIRRQSAWVYEWSDALAALDRYPWARLHPLAVHPQFADRVYVAARERLAIDISSAHSARRLTDWSDLCQCSAS
jgi:hypothetical protein